MSLTPKITARAKRVARDIHFSRTGQWRSEQTVWNWLTRGQKNYFMRIAEEVLEGKRTVPCYDNLAARLEDEKARAAALGEDE